ncbi:sodium:solute symporter family protein [bacterium]|nr:sodium:solute symporter family protein [bacterium]
MFNGHFHPVDLAIPALYAVVTLLIGIVRSRRKRTDSDEFLLMGRRLTLPAFTASLVTTWYGGILGVSEYSWRYGLSNWFVFGAPYYLYALILAIFLARRARQTRLYSIPDQLEKSYGKGVARLSAMVVFLMTMPAAYLVMLGTLGRWVTGWSYPVALGVGVLFSTLYLYSGGLRSVVRTDALQFFIMYGSFAMMVVMLYAQFGGLPYLKAHVPPELFTPTGGQTFAAVFVWYFIASTTLIEPAFYERIYSSSSHKTATWGIFIAIGFWALFDFMTTTTGLYARALLPNITDPTVAFPELARRVLPVGLLGLFLAGLLATVMSTVDSYSFIAAGAFGRDLLWKSRSNRHPSEIPRFVRIGLIVSSGSAFLLALTTESVVSLWHALGSVGAPVLLIPMLSSFSQNYRFPKRWVLPAMILSGVLSLIWILPPKIGFMDGYPLNIQPIYIGLGISLASYLFALRIEKRSGV